MLLHEKIMESLEHKMKEEDMVHGACVEGFRKKKMHARLRIWKQNKASTEHLKENDDDDHHQRWLERSLGPA
jgi:hypothetical protein